MNSSKKRAIISLWVLGLFTLTMLISPSLDGYGRVIENQPFTINGLDNYIEDFSTTTYLDGATTASGWGLGGVLNTRNYSWEQLDFFPTEYPAYGVAIQGRKAYVSCYNESIPTFTIYAFDINNPKDIKHLSYRHSVDKAYTCEVDGDYLYLGTTDERINFYNIQDPFDLNAVTGVYLGTLNADGAVTDVDIEGHLVYYTAFNSTSDRSLNIAYAEDPNNPREIICDWASPKALGLDVESDLAYLAASDEGFYIVNITDKYATPEVGHVDTPGNATDVLIDGTLAYLADGNEGIQIINVLDPTNPTILGGYNTPGNARRMILQETTLFVADELGGVQVLDVVNPAHPLFITELLAGQHVRDVDLMGGILVVTTDEGLHTFRISANWGLPDISQTAFDNPYSDYQVLDVRVQGNIAYVAGGLDGFYTLDISNPNQPVLLDRYETTHSVKKLDVEGQFAYVLASFGVFILDISDPTDIKETEIIPGAGLSDVDIEGELLYISFCPGFGIVNVSDIYSWSIIINYDPGVHANNTAIWVEGREVYMVEGTGGLTHEFSGYDVTDFTTPILTDFDDRFPGLYDVHADGDSCYLGAGGWMSLYNVSDPTAFTYPDWVTTSSMGVWSFGPNVLSAELTNGVSLYNTTNVYSISTIGNYPYATGALQITTNGDYTYVANQSSLIILRHFMSAGATFTPGTSFAQSTRIDSSNGSIITATLIVDDFVPAETSISYFMSADGGFHWEPVTPGVEHTFLHPGEDLRWKAEITGPEHCSAYIYTVEINFEFTEGLSPMWIAIIAGAGGLLLIIIATVVIAVVVKKKKATPTR